VWQQRLQQCLLLQGQARSPHPCLMVRTLLPSGGIKKEKPQQTCSCPTSWAIPSLAIIAWCQSGCALIQKACSAWWTLPTSLPERTLPLPCCTSSLRACGSSWWLCNNPLGMQRRCISRWAGWALVVGGRGAGDVDVAGHGETSCAFYDAYN
jgi:hypothetical protein